MSKMIYRSEWLDIVKLQEQQLRVSSFSRSDALDIGLDIVRLAKEKYNGAVSVSIIEDDMVVFCHKMKGTTIANDVWIFRKQNISKATGVSSLRAYIELECGMRKPTWESREDSYIACGGSYPVLMTESGTFAYITVSGLEHFLDHQIIVDALASHLGITTGEIAI